VSIYALPACELREGGSQNHRQAPRTLAKTDGRVVKKPYALSELWL